MSVEDIFVWIDRRYLCGGLTVERAGLVRRFQFDSGYITFASSSDPREHLGQLMLRRGLIDANQLQEAFRAQTETGVLLGRILVMTGAVDPIQVRLLLEEKICEGVYDTLGWTEGTFHFDLARPDDAVSGFEISVNLRTTFEQGLVRVQQWREIRDLIPSDDWSLEVVDESRALPPLAEAQHRTAVQRLVGSVRRTRTVQEIVAAQGESRFATLSRLAELVERGALAVRPPPTIAPTGAPGPHHVRAARDLEREARQRAALGDRGGALDLVARALHSDPDNVSLRRFHGELERAHFAQLSRDLLTRFCVPKLLKDPRELAAADLSDSERILAGRVDGRWDLLSLLRGAPGGKIDALITFKRLADRGIISL